jgi:hypothetical protein
LLKTYLRLGRKNDAGETVKLQNFLNSNLGTSLKSGIFDQDTFSAVENFQTKYWEEVLKPWVPFGLPTDHTPTGYVYKTTQREINNLYCPTLTLPIPQLP